jgi:RNA polymerase sigma factor (sigma-70 family)
MNELPDDEVCLPPSPQVIERLVAGHREFLVFLESRVANRAIAEEILQTAFVRTLEKGGGIEASESAIAWFYRVLRNAVTDYYRRRGSEQRALDAEARDLPAHAENEMRDAICQCMGTLVRTLKAEYAEIIRRIDLEEEPPSDVANALGLTSNNTAVRLHRARHALRRQLERSCGACATHGCLDCTCASPRERSGRAGR